ncbi:MAG: 50S ribosomal protein L25 [Acidobacteria bacterium]|jgi:large subunit ribosomal protein L25|nr:MAG: 50S ribosomal protein L25 [Acidobacteriota bacterium]
MATATEVNILEAQQREPGNKNAARRVRAAGKVPAVVYGAGKGTAVVSVDPRQVLRILKSESGHNTIFDLALGSDREKAMIVDWQFEPIKGKLLHIDLLRIAMDKKLTVTVPILLKGEPEGVKTQGGILEQLLREVELECLPADIPKSIEVDVSHLVFGVDVRVKDLAHGDKLKFLTDEDRMVAHITTVKEEVVATPEAVADAAATPAEPEVIKKGKQEAEGEEGEAKPEGKAEKSEKKEKK